MKDLITMQREGRDLLHTAGADGFAIDLNLENLDQHTANVWKAAQESMIEDVATMPPSIKRDTLIKYLKT